MKPTILPKALFWFFVIAVVVTVISVTAGTYYQYKVACAEPEIQEGISMAYQVSGGISKVWTTFLTLF